MLLAEALSSLQMILLGLSILVVAFLLRRSVRLGRRSKSRDVLSEVRGNMRKAEQSGAALIRKTEVRLHEHTREVEARMRTRIAVLDQLVREAGREIARLDNLLDEVRERAPQDFPQRQPDIIGMPTERTGEGSSNQTSARKGPDSQCPTAPTAEDRQTIRYLSQMGFSAEEIARCLDRPVSVVRWVLNDEKRSGWADAA